MKLERPVQAAGRFLKSAKRAKGFTEIGMRGGVGRIDLDGPGEKLDGFAMSSHLLGDDPETMKCAAVFRLDRENLPVDRLRFLEAPSLVVAESQCVSVLNRGGGHEGNRKQIAVVSETQFRPERGPAEWKI